MTKNYIHVFFLGVALGIIFKTICNILIMERTVYNENLGAGRNGADAAHLKLKKSGARVDKKEDRSLPKSRARSTKKSVEPGDCDPLIADPLRSGQSPSIHDSVASLRCRGPKATAMLSMTKWMQGTKCAGELGTAKWRCGKGPEARWSVVRRSGGAPSSSQLSTFSRAYSLERMNPWRQ